MAGWCLVLMAVPYEDVLVLFRTVSVRSTAVQNKPPPAPPDVQPTGSKTSSNNSGIPSGLPDLLQSVPRLTASSDDTSASDDVTSAFEEVTTVSDGGRSFSGSAAAGTGHCLPVVLRRRLHGREQRHEPVEVVARCGAQLRRVADELQISATRRHTADRVWRWLEVRLDPQHVLWTSIAIHVAYTAVRVST